MSKFVEFRAYIGPEWLSKTNTYHYNWSALNLGVATDFSFSTTLSAQLSAAGTTATVASASSFPSAGGVWIGPVAADQGWEYIRYNGKGATSLNALVRDPYNLEHTGIHNSGATVRFWYPLTTDNGQLSWTWQINQQWNANYWTGALSGVLVPKNVLRPRHAVVVQRRTTPTGSFTNYLLGWITSVKTADSSRYDAPWTIEFTSSPGMIQLDELPVFSVGNTNIAAGGTANASSTMAAAWKERASGDYVAAYPSFSAANVADDESDSLWISERHVGVLVADYTTGSADPTVAGGPGGSGTNIMFSEIHLSLAPGQPDGHRWIELTTTTGFDFVGQEMYLGSDDGAESLTFQNNQYMTALATGDRVIICENRERFEEESPGHGATQIIDLRDMGMPNFLKNRSLAGGSLGMWYSSGFSTGWRHWVCWGTVNKVTINAFSIGDSPTWSTPLSALTANSGKTLRYNWANSSTAGNNWTYSLVEHPGYKVGSAPQWLMVRLPPMGLTLKAAITSGYTGLVTLTSAGGDSNIGLERSGSITLQIGSEQVLATVSGTTQVNITARAQNGTTAAAHVAGDPIYVIVSSVATDAFKIKQIKWERSGGTIYPKDFKVYSSTLEDPRTPEETGYTVDWTSVANITNNLTAPWASSTIATRPRWILVEFTKMTTDPARARLNTIIAVLDDATMDSSTNLVTADAGDLIVAMLGYIGVPTGAITNNFSGTNLDNNSTGKGKAWSVITDICDFSAAEINCDQMSKLTISSNNFWVATIFSPVFTWTRANSNQPSFSVRANDSISQVQINWTTPDKVTSGSAVYPAAASGNGKVITYDNQIFENSGSADIAAQKRYLMGKYSWEIGLVTATDDSTNIASGQTHQITWDIDPALPDINRLLIATSIQHTISDRIPSTTIAGVEIERYGDEQ